MDRNNAAKLFVGNLALDTSQEDLMTLFAPYGQVVGCSVLRQFAFVHLQGDGAADRAIRDLNGREFKGRNLVVEESRGRPLNSTKVFVGNLSAMCSAEDLQELFQTFGKVIECDKVKGKPLSGRNSAHWLCVMFTLDGMKRTLQLKWEGGGTVCKVDREMHNRSFLD